MKRTLLTAFLTAPMFMVGCGKDDSHQKGADHNQNENEDDKTAEESAGTLENFLKDKKSKSAKAKADAKAKAGKEAAKLAAEKALAKAIKTHDSSLSQEEAKLLAFLSLNQKIEAAADEAITSEKATQEAVVKAKKPEIEKLTSSIADKTARIAELEADKAALDKKLVKAEDYAKATAELAALNKKKVEADAAVENLKNEGIIESNKLKDMNITAEETTARIAKLSDEVLDTKVATDKATQDAKIEKLKQEKLFKAEILVSIEEVQKLSAKNAKDLAAATAAQKEANNAVRTQQAAVNGISVDGDEATIAGKIEENGALTVATRTELATLRADLAAAKDALAKAQTRMSELTTMEETYKKYFKNDPTPAAAPAGEAPAAPPV